MSGRSRFKAVGTMSGRSRLVVMAVATVVLASVALVYVMNAARRNQPQAMAGQGAAIDLGIAGQIVFRNTRGGPGFGQLAVVPLARPQTERAIGPLACDRVYAAAGTGVCLTGTPGPIQKFAAILLDRNLRETRRMNPPGLPNRARIGGDGKLVSFTAFVTGHSYAKTGFSTRTSVLDITNDKFYADLETLRIFHNGARMRGLDINLWGVTFTPDGKRFYASISTGGRTHLIEANVATWEARTLRENVECPSVSPDGTRLVFKKRIAAQGARPWQLYVLDLATMTEKPLPGTENVDDQAAWLDPDRVMFALHRDGEGSDVWASAADGSGPPKLLIADAASPSAT